jgi:hypothetical protein
VKEEYEEFKHKVNGRMAKTKAQKKYTDKQLRKLVFLEYLQGK